MKTKKHISLDEIENKIPFGVPENYFENFAVQIDEQIGNSTAPIKRLFQPWMYMAAMFIGVFIMAQIFYTFYHNKTTSNIESYELYVLSQVDESSLIDFYLLESGEKQ
jgi:hypothetical protein